jgi:hypothetical protein
MAPNRKDHADQFTIKTMIPLLLCTVQSETYHDKSL